MGNEKKRLQELIEKREEYRYIVKALFDNPFQLTEEEQVEFMEENRIKIEELKQISEEINEIEWGLMTKQQQQDYLDKYSDD